VIRPIDLQNTVLAAQSTVPAVQRAEEGARTDAQTTQAAFAAELVHRDESVAPAAEVLEARVREKEKDSGKRDGHGGNHAPRTPFEQVVDEAAGTSDEAPHMVDFTA
jgi:hypothetical protein